MYAYLVQINDKDHKADLQHVFGHNLMQGQTKQSNVTIVFSTLSFEAVKTQAAKLPPRSHGQQHRFDVVPLGETLPL